MPKIRKKTSNRLKIHDRKKLEHKVRESKKKARRAAKNNPQWKSKKPKDPGIPNNFPFKDQILAEVSEQRRMEAAEKLRKKEEKKALRAKAKISTVEPINGGGQGEEEENETRVEIEELKGLQVGNDAVGGVGAKQLVNAKAFRQPKQTVLVEQDAMIEEKVPVLINHDLPDLQAVLDASDVVIQILDARDPLSFRSSHLEELVAAKPGQRILYILNKIDMCPRESVAAWATYLRLHHPTFMFRSATSFLPSSPNSVTKGKSKGKAPMRAGDGLGVDSVLACLGRWASAKIGDEQLTVAVVGITNVGKSSFINSLVRSNAVSTYSLETSSRGPTTTERPQEVTVEVEGKKIRLVDTPGLMWHRDEETENSNEPRARDILLRCKGRIDRLKDPTSVVSHIITRANAEDLMLLYNLPAFPQGDSNSFLSGIARSHQLVKKRGTLDLIGSSRILLRDWNMGRLARYTNPLKSSINETNDLISSKLYEGDQTILETVTSRRDLRKSAGLVSLRCGSVDTRRVVLDQPWSQDQTGESDGDGQGDVCEEEDEDEQEEEEGEEDDSEASDIEEEDGDESENVEGLEEGEEEGLLTMSRKQKRKRVMEAPAAPARKKVTFAPNPKESKRTNASGNKSRKRPKNEPIKSAASSLSQKQQPEKPATTTKSNRKVNSSLGKSAARVGALGNSKAYNFGEFF